MWTKAHYCPFVHSSVDKPCAEYTLKPTRKTRKKNRKPSKIIMKCVRSEHTWIYKWSFFDHPISTLPLLQSCGCHFEYIHGDRNRFNVYFAVLMHSWFQVCSNINSASLRVGSAHYRTAMFLLAFLFKSTRNVKPRFFFLLFQSLTRTTRVSFIADCSTYAAPFSRQARHAVGVLIRSNKRDHVGRELAKFRRRQKIKEFSI